MLSIRQAGISDIPLIRGLAHYIWPTAYGAILSAGQLRYMLQWIYSEESLATQMNHGQQFYLGYEDEQPVAFAALGPYDNDTWKLHKIYVSPLMQGKGAGKQLLQFAMQTAKKAGASTLILNVNRENPAQHFYKKMGFSIAEEVDIDIGEGYFMNDYVMRISL